MPIATPLAPLILMGGELMWLQKYLGYVVINCLNCHLRFLHELQESTIDQIPIIISVHPKKSLVSNIDLSPPGSHWPLPHWREPPITWVDIMSKHPELWSNVHLTKSNQLPRITLIIWASKAVSFPRDQTIQTDHFRRSLSSVFTTLLLIFLPQTWA